MDASTIFLPLALIVLVSFGTLTSSVPSRSHSLSPVPSCSRSPLSIPALSSSPLFLRSLGYITTDSDDDHAHGYVMPFPKGHTLRIIDRCG